MRTVWAPRVVWRTTNRRTDAAQTREMMLRALTVMLMALAVAPSASAAKVAGSLEDPQGDFETSWEGSTPPFGPNDLRSFGLAYDRQGTITVDYAFHDTSYFLSGHVTHAEVGFLRDGRCDVTSPGAASLSFSAPTDAPIPDNFFWSYAVVGHQGGERQHGQSFPSYDGTSYVYRLAQPAAFKKRGYDCVADVRSENSAGALDTAADATREGGFCMSARGTVPCATAGKPPRRRPA